MVLIGVLYFGQAFYSYLKKQAKQTAGRLKPRQSMQHASPRPASRPQITPQVNTVASKSPFLEGERPAALSSSDAKAALADSHSSPPESTDDETPSPIEAEVSRASVAHDELRRAVIWSEVLQRKF